MTIAVRIKEQDLGTFLKLRCIISYSGSEYEEFISTDFIVNGLATVRLHFKRKYREPLKCDVLAKAITGEVKVKVSCQDLDEAFYSEWLCKNEWKHVGKKQYSDISLDDVVTYILNFHISASKIEESHLLRLYNDVDFTDFSLSAGEGCVPVHRAQLAAHSDVFRAMLLGEWKETTEGRIKIEGVTLQTLQHFKDYMYLRTLSDDGLKPLLLFASYYLIDELKAECISKLALNCQAGDWSDLLKFATKNQIFELISAIMIVNPAVAIKKE